MTAGVPWRRLARRAAAGDGCLVLTSGVSQTAGALATM